MNTYIVGWIQREQFIRICRDVNWGYGPRVAVEQDDLAPVGLRFTLDDEEVDRLASERNDHKHYQRVKDQRYDPDRSSVEINRIGIAAEMAVGRWLGVSPDFSLYHGPDPGYDMVSKKGATVDAKANRRLDGVLYFNNTKKFRADVAVLVIVHHRAGISV